jgi:hypothetical protein
MMSIRRFATAVFLAVGLTNPGFAADSRPDVAQIISKSDASDILGEPVKNPSPRSGEGADGYYSKCNYYSVRRGKSLVIRLQLPGPNAIAAEKELQLVAAANGSTENVSGLGFASRVLMLYVVKGGAFLTIGVSGFANDAVALEKAKTVAQRLVERL